ncbi:MAG: hypothetical protein ISF22_00130 [Methanomassiliicoccus sp.]|nr:hypothetical protein [Methanomassiliicoccus sp.]
MSIEFSEALAIARQCVLSRTGDSDAVMLRYEKGDAHLFQFHTSKGDLDVRVDMNGEIGPCTPSNAEEAPERSVSTQDAVDKALCFIGDGRVERIRTKDGGYEIDVDREKDGIVRVFVDREGMVHGQKCSNLSRNLAVDID